MIDPRPDLKQDSKAWDKLLVIALETDINLAGLLHGFRCGGLRLFKERTGWVLRPEFDKTYSISIWASQEQYINDRTRWLVPHANRLIEVLNRLGGVI
jgi:hypothetical protein